jgi:hypothetical protein
MSTCNYTHFVPNIRPDVKLLLKRMLAQKCGEFSPIWESRGTDQGENFLFINERITESVPCFPWLMLPLLYGNKIVI